MCNKSTSPVNPYFSGRNSVSSDVSVDLLLSGAGMDVRYVGRATDGHMAALQKQMKAAVLRSGVPFSTKNDYQRLHHIDNHFIFFVCGDSCCCLISYRDTMDQHIRHCHADEKASVIHLDTDKWHTVHKHIPRLP